MRDQIMPMTVKTPIRRLTQSEFGEIAYEVMGVVYRLQTELGRFFIERVYKQALLASLPGVEVEVPIELAGRDFTTTRFLDVLVGGGAAGWPCLIASNGGVAGSEGFAEGPESAT